MLPQWSILPLVMLFAMGCGRVNQTTEIVEINSKEWFSPAELTFEVRDTVSRAQMQILLRYSNIISADSVELIVSTTTPDKVMWSDPFTIYTPKGEHSLHTVEAIYRDNISWRQLGEYRVSLHPQHIYHGVLSAGVNIIYK